MLRKRSTEVGISVCLKVYLFVLFLFSAIKQVKKDLVMHLKVEGSKNTRPTKTVER